MPSLPQGLGEMVSIETKPLTRHYLRMLIEDPAVGFF